MENTRKIVGQYFKGVVMALLVGRHLNKIDKKGRVSIPKQFRDALIASVGAASSGTSGFARVYVFPFFKYPALEGAGETFMNRLSQSLDDNLDLFSDDQEDLASITLESAHQLSFDSEGRVVLPGELCAHAEITSEALFVGRGSRFQIWSPELYEKHRGNAFARAREKGTTLNLGPARGPKPSGGG